MSSIAQGGVGLDYSSIGKVDRFDRARNTDNIIDVLLHNVSQYNTVHPSLNTGLTVCSCRFGPQKLRFAQQCFSYFLQIFSDYNLTAFFFLLTLNKWQVANAFGVLLMLHNNLFYVLKVLIVTFILSFIMNINLAIIDHYVPFHPIPRSIYFQKFFQGTLKVIPDKKVKRLETFDSRKRIC